MKTMVVLDETIVRYLLSLVERYGFSDLAINTTTREQLTTALRMLELARREHEREG